MDRLKDVRIALIVGATTGVFTTLYIAVRMGLHAPAGMDTIVLPLCYIASCIVALCMATKTIRLTYKSAFSMLIYSSLFCSLIFAGPFVFLDTYLFPNDGLADPFFMGVLIIQLMVRVPIDIIAAIFHKP